MENNVWDVIRSTVRKAVPKDMIGVYLLHSYMLYKALNDPSENKKVIEAYIKEAGSYADGDTLIALKTIRDFIDLHAETCYFDLANNIKEFSLRLEHAAMKEKLMKTRCLFADLFSMIHLMLSITIPNFSSVINTDGKQMVFSRNIVGVVVDELHLLFIQTEDTLNKNSKKERS